MAPATEAFAVRCDESGRVLEVACETIGLSRHPVVGTNLSCVLAAGNEGKLAELLAEIAEQGSSLDRDIYVDTPAGPRSLRFIGVAAESGFFITAIQRDQHFLEGILETTPNIVFIFNLESTRFDYINPVLARVLGVDPAAAMTRDPRVRILGGELLGPSGDDWAEIMRANDGAIMEREYRVLDASGEEHLLASREKVFSRDAEGVPRQILGIAMDVTESRRIADALLESQESYRRQFAESSSVMLMVDPVDRRIVEANSAAARMYGYSVDRLACMRIDDLSESSAAEIEDTISEVHPEDGQQVTFRHRLADGTTRDVEITTSRIESAGRTLLHSIIHDVTERTRLEAQLDTYARTDSLTHAANRRSFIERATLERARAIRHGRPLSIVALDLNDLKGINDTHGHAVGDEALVAFATTCRENTRIIDLVARFGGDEFVLLLPETGSDGGRVVAERVLTALKSVLVGPEHAPFRVAACAGVASLASGHESLDQLLSRADSALYRAKGIGLACVEVAP